MTATSTLPAPTTPVLADGIPVHCAHNALVKTNELKPHPRNPNVHPKEQIQAFAKIIQTLGWRQAIVVSSRSGLITKGHGKLAVARYLQCREVPVDFQAYKDEAEEWQDILADNKIAEMSERDEAAVASMIRELQEQGANTQLTGYRDQEVERMMAKLRGADAAPETPQEAEAEAILAKWGVKPGQLYQLGPHRILCGDATSAKDWARLMDANLAQLVHTDPPYGIDYNDRKEVSNGKVANDELKGEKLTSLIRGAMKQAVAFTHGDAAFYVWHANRRDFERALDAVGLLEKQYITWVKDCIVMGRLDYHPQTEHAFYCEKVGNVAKWMASRTESTVWRVARVENDGNAIALGNGLHLTDGEGSQVFVKENAPKAGKFRHLRLDPGDSCVIADKRTTTAWEVKRDNRMEYLHPTQKPTELAEIALRNSSNEGDIVVDCFGGSFSTLIAAHNMKRRGFVMDLEPKWCAVGIERWHRATNEQPVLLP